MAQRVSISLVDDLDQSEASETVAFGLDGRGYEIDLNEGHADELRAALELYIEHARSAGRPRGTRNRRSPVVVAAPTKATAVAPRSSDSSVIRAWAADNGIAVSTRGRISAEVLAQYEAAAS